MKYGGFGRTRCFRCGCTFPSSKVKIQGIRKPEFLCENCLIWLNKQGYSREDYLRMRKTKEGAE